MQSFVQLIWGGHHKCLHAVTLSPPPALQSVCSHSETLQKENSFFCLLSFFTVLHEKHCTKTIEDSRKHCRPEEDVYQWGKHVLLVGMQWCHWKMWFIQMLPYTLPAVMWIIHLLWFDNCVLKHTVGHKHTTHAPPQIITTAVSSHSTSELISQVLSWTQAAPVLTLFFMSL